MRYVEGMIIPGNEGMLSRLTIWGKIRIAVNWILVRI